MKVLVLLNEVTIGAHEDVYRAIDSCINNGIIDEKIIYSFLAEITAGKKEKYVLNEIVNISKNYQPDLILWMHTDEFEIKNNTIMELRNLKSKPVMGFWEGDFYQSPYRPVSKKLLNLYVACDVVFVPGFGELTEKMKNYGCKDIRYVPLFGDDKRFYSINSGHKKIYDIVMIGNNITSINPFRISLPGTRLRKEIVKKFSKRYSSRFAVFGNNWKGNSAKGYCLYNDQHKIYSKSRIAISINNYTGKYYFSDRLPIAMLTEIPIIHNYEEGFEKLFKDCKEMRFFKSLEEAVKQCEELLEKSDMELKEIGKKLYNYATEKLTADIAFEYMLSVLKEIYFKKNTNGFNIRTQNPWMEGIS